MRKMTELKLIVVLFFLVFSSTQAMAAERYGSDRTGYNYISTSSKKLVTGVGNAATGIVELPKNIILTTQQDTIAHGMTFGLVSGVMHTVARTVIGVFDVATFWIPTAPSIQPAYVWEDFSTETSY